MGRGGEGAAVAAQRSSGCRSGALKAEQGERAHQASAGALAAQPQLLEGGKHEREIGNGSRGCVCVYPVLRFILFFS